MKINKSNIAPATLYFALGLLMIIFRADLLNILFTLVGVCFLVIGIYRLIKKELVEGCIEIVLAIILISLAWLVAKVALIIIGCGFLLWGAYIFLVMFDFMKNAVGMTKVLLFAQPILLALVGVLFFLSYTTLGNFIFVLIGLLLLVGGGIILTTKTA